MFSPFSSREPVTFDRFVFFARPTRFFRALHKTVILRGCDFLISREKGLLSTSPASQQPSCPLVTVLFFRNPLLFVIPSVPGFPTHRSHPRQQMWCSLEGEPHAVLIEAATLDRKSGEAEGHAVRPSGASHAPGSHKLVILRPVTFRTNRIFSALHKTVILPARRAVGAKRLADLSHNEGLTARSRRTSATLVRRCYSGLSGQKHRKSVEKHFHEGSVELQILSASLRSGMTKQRAAAPQRVVHCTPGQVAEALRSEVVTFYVCGRKARIALANKHRRGPSTSRCKTFVNRQICEALRSHGTPGQAG